MSKRSKSQYPNLNRKMNLKRRQEMIDFDYLHKLSDEEKQWLNKFMGEYMGASFRYDVGEDGKTLSKKNIHKKDLVKPVYDQNNARNRDIYAKKTSTGGMEFFDEVALDDLREKNLYTEITNFDDGFIYDDMMRKDDNLYEIELVDFLNSLKPSERRDELLYYLSKTDRCHKFLLNYFSVKLLSDS